jgi:dihydroorotase
MATDQPKILIKGGRVIDPASGFDAIADVAVAEGKILALGAAPAGFKAEQQIDAKGLIVAPGFVDLCARVGGENSVVRELQAAAAGGVTSLVCPPDTSPLLDEPGNVEMLLLRAAQSAGTGAHLLPLGALMRGLGGAELCELVHLSQAGCVGFSHGDEPIANTQTLQRALQYAATFGYTLWLHPRDAHLGHGGVAASGAVATRLGLSGVPVAAETLALFTIFELVRATGCRVHISRLSSAAGVALVRAAKLEGLPVTCDVSVHNLLLCDVDVGYFDTHYRLSPVLRTPRDRDALQAALKDGTIDALVSDHTPVAADAKLLPFAEAQAGASAVELLLPLLLQWGKAIGLSLPQTIACVTSRAAACLTSTIDNTGNRIDRLASNIYGLQADTVADIVIFDPAQTWQIYAANLRSSSASTPWLNYEMQGRVVATCVAGKVAYSNAKAIPSH